VRHRGQVKESHGRRHRRTAVCRTWAMKQPPECNSRRGLASNKGKESREGEVQGCAKGSEQVFKRRKGRQDSILAKGGFGKRGHVGEGESDSSILQKKNLRGPLAQGGAIGTELLKKTSEKDGKALIPSWRKRRHGSC